MLANNESGSFTTAEIVNEQLFASVIVSVYVPPDKLLMSSVEPDGFQLYVIVPEPPTVVTSIEPFAALLQLTLVVTCVAEGPLGVVTLVDAVPEQPLASVMVTW